MLIIIYRIAFIVLLSQIPWKLKFPKTTVFWFLYAFAIACLRRQAIHLAFMAYLSILTYFLYASEHSDERAPFIQEQNQVYFNRVNLFE